ncbi:MAG: hypothetical protein AB2696_08085 [Candidatus Thiodiazotropha sp.]|nr:hypothetical protein [Candidatus Thiodiazotropha sp. (ex Lucina pensylvanica)]
MKTDKFNKNLTPWSDNLILQRVIEVDPRGRIRIPTQFTHNIEWIKSPRLPSDALAVLDEPGRILFLSWEKHAQPIIEKRRELLEIYRDSQDARDTLIQLEDRYKHFIIPADLRPTLVLETKLHLEITLETKSYVYARKVFDRIEIISPKFRNQQRNRHLDLIDELP